MSYQGRQSEVDRRAAFDLARRIGGNAAVAGVDRRELEDLIASGDLIDAVNVEGQAEAAAGLVDGVASDLVTAQDRIQAAEDLLAAAGTDLANLGTTYTGTLVSNTIISANIVSATGTFTGNVTATSFTMAGSTTSVTLSEQSLNMYSGASQSVLALDHSASGVGSVSGVLWNQSGSEASLYLNDGSNSWAQVAVDANGPDAGASMAADNGLSLSAVNVSPNLVWVRSDGGLRVSQDDQFFDYIDIVHNGSTASFSTNDGPFSFNQGVDVSGSLVATQSVRAATGTSLNTSGFVFNGDTDTGMFRPSSNQIEFRGSSTRLGFLATSAAIFPAAASQTTGFGSNVYVDSGNGKLFRSTSARKYKTNERPIDGGRREAFFENVHGVVYNSLGPDDDASQDFVGVIADDVVDVFPELVTFDGDGEVEGFMYDRVVALLIDEVRSLRARVNDLENA